MFCCCNINDFVIAPKIFFMDIRCFAFSKNIFYSSKVNKILFWRNLIKKLWRWFGVFKHCLILRKLIFQLFLFHIMHVLLSVFVYIILYINCCMLEINKFKAIVSVFKIKTWKFNLMRFKVVVLKIVKLNLKSTVVNPDSTADSIAGSGI